MPVHLAQALAPHPLPLSDMLVRLAVGAFLGVLIGFERQWRHAAAGVQTSGLVATGATLFSLTAPALGATSDHLRVVAAIVTGVGFLAGGVILKEGMNVSGLNTAATIWATAAVGALAGVGLLREAALGAVTIVVLNLVFLPLVNAINQRIAANHPPKAT